jgi:hypothetical protein
MGATVEQGPVIFIGYEYRLRIEVDSAVFPEGCSLVAQVRASVNAAEAIGVLSTAAGGLERVDDFSVDLVIGAALTAVMDTESVVVDIVRTDLDPDQHLGFLLEIPVRQAVTRGL